jgi:adenosylcobinamide kinase / adenosylcobinamide-phosphate guanylyltransferase
VIALVLGGARSGKSGFAERLAATLPAPVTYVATGTAWDDDMAERIARHRDRRPAAWGTEEVGGALVEALDRLSGTVLVDSLGTWVAACDMAPDVEALLAALRRRSDDTVLVGEEVGLGVHPPTELGVRFRDAVGEVNAAVAEVADDVRLVVAGRGLRLDRLDP